MNHALFSAMPSKILYIASNPLKTDRLETERERREVLDLLRGAPGGNAIEIIPLPAARFTDIRRALHEHHPTIVYFTGHGTIKNTLVLEDDSGGRREIGPAVLAGLVGQFAEHVKLVVLNACQSEPLAEEVAKHIDCAIGMTEPIQDSAGRAFAGAFFEALAFGGSVQKAFELGRNAVLASGTPERIPRLFERQPGLAAKSVPAEKPQAPAEPGKFALDPRRRSYHLVVASLVALVAVAGVSLAMSRRREMMAKISARLSAIPVSGSMTPDLGPSPTTRMSALAPPSTPVSYTPPPLKSLVASPTLSPSGTRPAAPPAFATSGSASCSGTRCTLNLGGIRAPPADTRVCLDAPDATALRGTRATCSVTSAGQCVRYDTVSHIELKGRITWETCRR